MKELVDYIVRSLVDNPEFVQVNETAGSSVIILEISVGLLTLEKSLEKKDV